MESQRMQTIYSDPRRTSSTLEDVRAAFEIAERATFEFQHLKSLTERLKRGHGHAPSALLSVVARANRSFPEYWDGLAAFLEVTISKVDFSQEIPIKPGVSLFFGSFETFYAEMIEPWAGPLDKLMDRLRRFRDGKITREQGVAETMANAPNFTGHGVDNRDNITVEHSRRGTSASYLATRIKADHPAIAAALKRGEFKSMRSAAIAAGIIKPAFTIPADVEGAARALRRRFDADQRRRLAELLMAD